MSLIVEVHAWLSHFMSNSLQPYGPQPAKLLCPWDSPGENTGVGCLAPSYKGSFQSRDRTHVSCIDYIGRWILNYWTMGEAPNSGRDPPHIYRSALPSPSLEPSLWKHLIGRELGPACLDHAQTVGSRKSRTLTATWVPHLRPPSQRPSPRNQHHPHQLPQGCMGRLEHPLPATARKQGQERPG